MRKEQKKKPLLTKPARVALQNHLDRLLSNLVVVGDWPDFDDYPEMASFHQALAAHEPWRSHVTVFDLFELFANVMQRSGVKAEGGPRKLIEVLDKERFKTFSEELRDHLLSIPREYKMWVELPAMPQWGVGSIKLSERLQFVETENKQKTGAEMVADALMQKGVRSLPVKVGKNSVYLTVETSGYGSSRVDTTAVADGISQIKQFFQMFRRTAMFKTESLLKLLGEPPRIECWIVDMQFPEDRRTLRLPHSLTRFLATATVAEENLKVYDFGKPSLSTLLGAEKRPAETREERATALLDSMTWVRKLIDCPPSEDVSRIRSAFEWAFDSEESDNQTLSFIQACIGLEALLGDSPDEEPLVARLKDRCAYLLGKSHADRESIRKRFGTMYNVRSKLVHGRTPRLSLSDAQQLYYAQTMLGDVISEEAQRLLKNLKD